MSGQGLAVRLLGLKMGMKTRWTHVLAFLVGITLTVGVYEARRLLRNTSRALSVASGQMVGEAQANSKRQALLEALEKERGAEALSALKERRDDRKSGRTQGARTAPDAKARSTRSRTARTLTPQQVRDIKDRRRQRRSALEAGEEVPRVRRPAGAAASEGDRASGDAPMEDPPEEILDTAIPLPAE